MTQNFAAAGAHIAILHVASVAPLFVWRLTRTVTAYSTTTSGTNNYNQALTRH